MNQKIHYRTELFIFSKNCVTKNIMKLKLTRIIFKKNEKKSAKNTKISCKSLRLHTVFVLEKNRNLEKKILTENIFFSIQQLMLCSQ